MKAHKNLQNPRKIYTVERVIDCYMSSLVYVPVRARTPEEAIARADRAILDDPQIYVDFPNAGPSERVKPIVHHQLLNHDGEPISETVYIGFPIVDA